MLRVGTTGAFCGVSEKSSTANPSSAPETLESVQRIQKVAPLAIESALIVLERAVRLAATLPSSAPTVVVKGLIKLSAATPVQVPVAKSVALVLYPKLI